MKPQRLYGIGTDLHMILENINSIFRSFRIHISVGSQLFYRTHHAVRRYPPQFTGLDRDAFFRQRTAVMAACDFTAIQYHRYLIPFFYIRRTGHNLDHLGTDIHLAHDQLIRIRMSLDLLDLTDHYLLQIVIPSAVSFHFRSRQCHSIHIFLICTVQIRHICLDPR